MDLTIIQQGRFTSDETTKILSIRSDLDWMWIYNFTEAANPNGNAGVKYYWQRGMNDNDGFIYQRNAGATADLLTTCAAIPSNGFSLVDSAANPVGPARAVTSTTNAAQPQINTGNTSGIAAGSIVRLVDITGAPNLGGIDFEVNTVTLNTSFVVSYALANAPGAGTPGFYRRVIYDSLYYPRRRFAVNITQAAQAVVTMSVTHAFTVGQQVRFIVPDEWGMTEMDGLVGNIVAINVGNNTITVDIDSTAFTVFAFPLAAAFPFSPALVVPIGEDTPVALQNGANILADATVNQSLIGIALAPGDTSPAGENNDVIYWVAGKSFSVDNE